MASILLRRTLTAAAAAGLTAVFVITPGRAHVPRPPSMTQASVASAAGPARPRPPRLPANFRGTGRYIVSDLGVNVPFSWQGSNGNSQMIAGGPRYRIWFTNLIYRNALYTVTYKWPRIPLDPNRHCDKIENFSRQDFNNLLKTSRFVGPRSAGGQGPVRRPLAGGRRRGLPAAGPRFPAAGRHRRHLRRSARPEPVVAGAPVRPAEPLRPAARRVVHDDHVQPPAGDGDSSPDLPQVTDRAAQRHRLCRSRTYLAKICFLPGIAPGEAASAAGAVWRYWADDGRPGSEHRPEDDPRTLAEARRRWRSGSPPAPRCRACLMTSLTRRGRPGPASTSTVS